MIYQRIYSEIKNKFYRYRIFWASLAIFIAVILWGLSFVSMKIVMNSGLPPYTMITLRYLIVSGVLFIIFNSFKRSHQKKKIKRDQHLFLWSGAIGITAYFLFEAKGISLTTASTSSMIIAMVPVFTVIADWLFFQQYTSRIQMMGIFLSLAGVYVIFSFSRNPGEVALQPLTGNLLMLGACFCWVAYSVLSKNLHRRYDSFTITTIQSFYGTVLLIPFAFLETASWVTVSTLVWAHLFYLAILCSILAYYLYNVALRVLGMTIVSVYVNLIPVVGVLGGVFVLNEPIFPLQILGGMMILLSLFLVNQRKKSLNPPTSCPDEK